MLFQAETFARVLEAESDGSDEKAIAAMGILNTLDTLVTVLGEQKEVLKKISEKSATRYDISSFDSIH